MKKIKYFFDQTLQSEKGKDVLIVIIVILVGLGSFELGRLSAKNGSSGVKIEYPGQNNGQDDNTNVTDATVQNSELGASAVTATEKTFFASSKGKKYYTTSCSAGKTIKQENRVYFTTGEEAEAAGYTLSSSCN